MSNITQRGATGALALQASGSFQSSNDANLTTLVGTRWDLADGREVIFVSTGATAVSTAGLLVQDAAIVPNHQNLAVTAYTAYSANGNTPASFIATLGATALTANQYQGGFVVVNSGPGIGQTLRIQSHPSALASSTLPSFVLEDAPNTALTTSSKVCLIPPHGANVILNPTTSTGALVGITLYPLPAGSAAGGTTPSFGFVTCTGVASALSDAAIPAVGQSIAPSVVTAGTITLAGGTGATIGYANQTAVSAEARSVFVNL